MVGFEGVLVMRSAIGNLYNEHWYRNLGKRGVRLQTTLNWKFSNSAREQ